MTKREFQALTLTLAATRPVVVQPGGASVAVRSNWETWRRIVDGIADVCAAEYANFDRAQFLDATHYDDAVSYTND